MQVIEGDKDGALPGEPLEERREQLMHGAAIVLAIGVEGGEGIEGAPAGPFEFAVSVFLEGRAERRDHLTEGGERPGLGAELIAATAEDEPAVRRGPRSDFGGEARLADAGLAGDEERRALALLYAGTEGRGSLKL